MKKKLLFIYGQLNGGGAERVLLDILNNIDYSRHEVDLCQIVGGGTLIDEIPKEVNIIQLWSKYSWSYSLAVRLSLWAGLNCIFTRKLQKKINKTYDLEISFLEGYPLKIHAMMKTVARKVTWVHCDLDKFRYEATQFRKGEELAAYNKMDTVACVSHDTLEAFNRRFPECRSHKAVIYNPVDVEKILKLSTLSDPPKPSCFTIVTVGRLTLQKRPDRIVRMARKMKNEGLDVQFQWIGDGELRNDFQEQCRKSGVENMVHILGFKRNPFPYIKQADMMFCCSEAEGFCLVICEAMCLGVPVVSTRTSGPVEIIGDNEYGLLCGHNDDEMFTAIKRMMEDVQLRKHYVQKGRNRVKDFAVDKIIHAIECL